MKNVTKTDLLRLSGRVVNAAAAAADGNVAVFDGSGRALKDSGIGAAALWHAGNDGPGSGLVPDIIDLGGDDCNVTPKEGLFGFQSTSSTMDNRPGNHNNVLSFGFAASKIFQIAAHYGDAQAFFLRSMANSSGAWKPWAKIWTSETQGSGSGLDADTVDGCEAGVMQRYRGTLPGNANFNDYTSMGIWNIGDASGMANDPGLSWATLVVTRASYIRQQVYRWNGDIKKERYSNRSTWTSWASY
jgi:hypothetical protein